MSEFEKMKASVDSLLSFALESGEVKVAEKAARLYLNDLGTRQYDATGELNKKLFAVIKAQILTAERLKEINANGFSQLLSGSLAGYYNGDEDMEGLISLLPLIDEDELVKMLSPRFARKGRDIEDKISPIFSRFSRNQTEIKELTVALTKSVKTMFKDSKKHSENQNELEILNEAVDFVISEYELTLHAKVEDVIYLGNLIVDAMKEEPDNKLLLDSVSEKVKARLFFHADSWPVESTSVDLLNRISRSLSELSSEITEFCIKSLGLELPTFDAWWAENSEGEVAQNWLNDGLYICDAVCDSDNIETHPFLIVPSNEAVDEMRRYFELDKIEWGHNDEYTLCGCGNCQTAVRTSANGWGWQPGYIITDCGCVLIEHADEDDINSYVSEMINDSSRAVNCPSLDLSLIGFKELEGGFEKGWYGREDEPSEVLAKLQKSNPGLELLFRVDDVGQFRANFSVWSRGKIKKGRKTKLKVVE